MGIDHLASLLGGFANCVQPAIDAKANQHVLTLMFKMNVRGIDADRVCYHCIQVLNDKIRVAAKSEGLDELMLFSLLYFNESKA